MSHFLGFSILSTFILGMTWIISCFGKYMVEKFVTIVLDLIHPTKDTKGNQLSGPDWKWVDGQTLDKFLDGRAMAEKWQRYGPIYRIWSGSTPEIVIAKPEDIRTFYSDSNVHNKAKSSNAGWFFHQLLGECMGLINGSRWMKLRADFGSAFHYPVVKEKTVFINAFARQYVERLVPQNSQDGRHKLKAAEAVSKFPFFYTATHLYGALSDGEKDRLWALGQRSSKLMTYVLQGGSYRFAFSRLIHRKAASELVTFCQLWAEFNNDLYHSRYKMSPKPPIVSAWQSVIDGEVSQEEALHTLSEILFANLDVATGTLSWLVIFLAMDTANQEELRKEIRQNSDDIESYYARKDTLLAWSLMETLRLRPFTVFSIPESSPAEKILAGYRIPAHTSVVIDTLAINTNKEFWGEKNVTYWPQRFKSISAIELRYNLFTFGFGTRKCLGSHLGELMMKAFIVQLLDRYTLSMPSTEQEGAIATLRDSWVPISAQEVVFARIDSTPKKSVLFSASEPGT